MLLAPELFRIHALAGARFQSDKQNNLREVRRSLKGGAKRNQLQRQPKSFGRGTIKSAEWSESEGLLMFHGKIYVPNDRDLRRRIIEQHHNTRIAGHAGRFKTLELVSCNYWWPQMSRYMASMLSTVICTTGLKYNVDDPSVSSIPRKLLKHYGM
jgi:hypothetical protein